MLTPAAIGAYFLGGVVEQGGDTLVPPQGIACQIPVPNRVIRGARNDLEAFFAPSKLVLRLLALGDVLTYSHQLQRVMGLVEHPFPLTVEQPDSSIGTDDPLFKLEGFKLPEGLLDNLLGRTPILGMNPFEVAFKSWFELIGKQPENPAEFL